MYQLPWKVCFMSRNQLIHLRSRGGGGETKDKNVWGGERGLAPDPAGGGHMGGSAPAVCAPQLLDNYSVCDGIANCFDRADEQHL